MNDFGRRLVLLSIFTLAGLTFFTGIDWGLPSHDSDRFLFGDRTPWTGRQIMDLAGTWDESANRGADIAMHPLTERNKPIELNDTDAKRAEIIRRYRLYSCQPDEMITFRSLSSMKPPTLALDPKMYQYGGLWIYPIGGLLKMASMLHLVTLRTDLAFYLDHPEIFARFYLIARCYSAMWGLLGVLVVYWLGMEWTGDFLVGSTAAGLYASMPVVIDLAHEAKPHLAGTVLILLTMLAAMRYVRSGLRRWWIITGIAAGAATGTVLTGYAALLVQAVMVMLRPATWKNRIRIAAISGLIAFATFAMTNPFLLINVVFHRELLHSNVGNYGTFYKPAFSVAGLMMTVRSVVEGMSLPAAVVGSIAAVVLCIRDRRLRPMRESSGIQGPPSSKFIGRGQRSVSRLSLLLFVPTVAVLMQMVLLGQGKTAEYARFGLLADVTLALGAATLIGHLALKPGEKRLIAVLLIGGTLFYGVRYDANFVLDHHDHSTRYEAAGIIQACNQRCDELAVWSEPAPYCLPPVDLFTWHLVLMPVGSDVATMVPGTIAVRPVDYPMPLPPGIRQFKQLTQTQRPLSPISWANKPFEVLGSTRRTVSQPTTRP